MTDTPSRAALAAGKKKEKRSWYSRMANAALLRLGRGQRDTCPRCSLPFNDWFITNDVQTPDGITQGSHGWARYCYPCRTNSGVLIRDDGVSLRSALKT